jgi:endonuclease-3
MAVDTHVFRVANRMGLAVGDTPEAVEEELVKIIPAEFARHAHHWLILHGRYVCTARSPKCAECTVAKWCGWEEKMVR